MVDAGIWQNLDGLGRADSVVQVRYVTVLVQLVISCGYSGHVPEIPLLAPMSRGEVRRVDIGIVRQQ